MAVTMPFSRHFHVLVDVVLCLLTPSITYIYNRLIDFIKYAILFSSNNGAYLLRVGQGGEVPGRIYTFEYSQ